MYTDADRNHISAGSRLKPAVSARGFTLLEMLIVTALIGLMSAIAIIAVMPDPGMDQQSAVHEVKAALRHAQRETIEKQVPHIVKVNTNSKTIGVYRRDFSTTPFIDHIVLHPLTKSAYLVQLEAEISANFQFSDNTTATEIGFVPLWGAAPGKLTPLAYGPGPAGKVTAATEIVTIKGNWLGDWKNTNKDSSTVNYKIGDWVAVGAHHWICITGHSATPEFQPAVTKDGKTTVYWERYNHITVETKANASGINVLPVTGRVAQGDRF